MIIQLLKTTNEIRSYNHQSKEFCVHLGSCFQSCFPKNARLHPSGDCVEPVSHLGNVWRFISRLCVTPHFSKKLCWLYGLVYAKLQDAHLHCNHVRLLVEKGCGSEWLSNIFGRSNALTNEFPFLLQLLCSQLLLFKNRLEEMTVFWV